MFKQFTRPALLRPGDRIRIVAPSGPVDHERFHLGVQYLQAAGFKPLYNDGVLSRSGYLAGSDERRVNEFLAALDEPDIAAIWFARGGYGATRLMAALEDQLIMKHQPWLIGFSDASAMHARWQRAGLQSLHTTNITGLSGWSEFARQALFNWLTRASMPPLNGKIAQGNDRVEGPLIGGNITVLAAMAGTGYLPSCQGAIVFLEDVGERPYRLDRCLTQLCQCGFFDGAAGFAIGQLTHCENVSTRDGQTKGPSALDAVISVLQPMNVPILTNLPAGHERSSFSLPFGSPAILDCEQETLAFLR